MNNIESVGIPKGFTGEKTADPIIDAMDMYGLWIVGLLAYAVVKGTKEGMHRRKKRRL